MNCNFLAKNSITRWALYFYVLSLSVFAQDFDSGVVKTNEHSFIASTFSEGYEIPWGMAFLPNNDLLVSTDLENFIVYRMTVKSAQKLMAFPKYYIKAKVAFWM